MTEARQASSSAAPSPVPGGLKRTVVQAILAALIFAIIVVYAYYNDPWRPAAHILGPWAVLATAVAFRQRLAPAVIASVTFLAVAVITFYIGLKVGHDIRWAGTPSQMGVPWQEMQLWLLLAAIAGGAFGLLGSNASRRDWRGPAATAGLIGLLLGEAFRRQINWGLDVAVGVDLFLAVAVFVTAAAVNRRTWLTLALTVGTAAVGFVAVSAPDFLQQVLVTG
jgi:hypothetical protein